jgi:2-polyprenyl-3-methyl-5-hydroxy-6-metoxy-1,4-benzoquinol methylase
MQYDAVICSEVLEHLHDPSTLLHTIYMTLKEEGILIVTVPNGRGPRELFVTRPTLKARESAGLWKVITKIKKILGFSGTTIQSHADNLDHVQFFTLKALYKLAARNHFTITCIAKTNFVEDVFPFSLFTKRSKALQKFDCMVAEWLPPGFTGGFNTIWKKVKS